MKLHEVIILADKLLKKYNLHDWDFTFDRAKKRFWSCNYSRKVITISNHLAKINSEELVKNTILHEIAHAICGKDEWHWKKWKEIAKKIGCDWVRCYWDEVNQVKMKYTAKCKNCEKSFQTSRKRKLIACKNCCEKFNNWKFSHDFIFEFIENF